MGRWTQPQHAAPAVLSGQTSIVTVQAVEETFRSDVTIVGIELIMAPTKFALKKPTGVFSQHISSTLDFLRPLEAVHGDQDVTEFVSNGQPLLF